MARITLTVELQKHFWFERPKFSYGTERVEIYKFLGEDGKTYVWKTTGYLSLMVEVPYGTRGTYMVDTEKQKAWISDGANEGDKMIITASVKGESEYKGEPQTELTRVKIKEYLFRAETAEEKAKRIKAEKEAKKQEQLDSLKGEDFIWKMPYHQYKDHYSDCETVIDSYEKHVDKYGFVQGPPTIKVIIREGRLKASGVRGQHYAGYRIRYTLDGKEYVEPFRAVCERTAINQARKAHPEATNFSLDEIIYYRPNWDI